MKRADPAAACTCPDDNPDAIAVDCVIHFGIGYGHCVPHAVDVDIIIAATEVRHGVPVCASCARAGRRAERRLVGFKGAQA